MSEIVSAIPISLSAMTQLCRAIGNLSTHFLWLTKYRYDVFKFYIPRSEKAKRQKLIKRAQRRVRQAKAKREMYEGASWATDISNEITTVAKKATESTQTDSTPKPSEALKKTLIDEYSQTNPEVSTTPEVNVKPMMIDTGVEAKPSVIDVGVSAKPLVIDVGINNTPIMNDAMVGEDALII
ncbi:unnamed protein product [Phytophthora lilii]|uniref:Unnamed protein product n=1 Tax=Phytophthora lilii TaxID=2077276 RepID=A0A9W7CRZ1_9STRA|nr:unnamed protein product [Phytophthora lilii]